MDHRVTLARLADRGRPRGADAVFRAARSLATGEPSEPRRVRTLRFDTTTSRGALVAVAFAGALAVGTIIVLVAAPGDEMAVSVPTADTTTRATTETTRPGGPEPPTIPLVARDAWPSPALDPVLSLPSCPEPELLASFMATEFQEADGHDYQSMPPSEVASVIPLPRVGAYSLFTVGDVAGSCFISGRRGEVVGWWMGDASGGWIARAAARDVGLVEVPVEASGGPYIQWRDASMHPFTGSVYPSGRAQVAAGPSPGRYTVIEVAGGLPDDGTGADRLAASLAATPVRMDLFSSPTLLPAGLPAGYGVCLGDLAQLGAGWIDSRVYCDGTGRHIEIHGEIYGRHSPGTQPGIPTHAEPTRVGAIDARTWTADGRRWIVVEAPRGRAAGAPVTVSASGPSDVRAGTLEAVLASTVALRPGVVTPRSGAGDLTGSVTVEALSVALSSAGASSVTPRGDSSVPPEMRVPGVGADFVLDTQVVGDAFAMVEDRGAWLSGDFVELAFLMSATDAISLGPVDALIAAGESDLAARFSCGGVTFAVWLVDAGEPPQPRNPGWSADPERWAFIVGFLIRLVDALGCEA
jgi:hypothetical protein